MKYKIPKYKNKICLLLINSFLILFTRFYNFCNISIYLFEKIILKQIFYKKNFSILNICNKTTIINGKNHRVEALNKGKKYLNKCLKGILTNKHIKYFNNNCTILTVIIPIFNCEKTIKATIRSIQNQNFLDIEIILVNDFSKDNSLKIIEKFKKEDLRIKIVNNNKNMGTLYSRCIGALLSQGEYIFALDNDDMFFDDDVFEFIYKNAKNGNFDIIGFKSIFIDNIYNFDIKQMKDGPLPIHSNNLIILQPELGVSSISKLGEVRDINIWGKCIKNKIYVKGINFLGIKRYSIFMSWAEDTSMVFIIFNIAKSYKYVNKYGIIHFNDLKTASYTQPDSNKLFGLLFLLDIIFDFSKNNTNKNSAVYFALNNIKLIEEEKNILFFKYILKKIMKCKYITKSNKRKLKDNFLNFLYKKYKN